MANFDKLFVEQEDGSLVFRRSKSSAPVPVSWEHYGEVRVAFESVHQRNQIILMLTGLLMGGYGLYAVIFEDRYGTFFASWAVWLLLNIGLAVRDTTALVQHLIDQETARAPAKTD